MPPCGSASRKTTDFGALKWASRSRTHSMMSCSDGQAASGSSRVRLQGDVRARHLAPSLVRDADDGDLGHRGMGGDGLLHLDRRDVLAAGHDHVLLAIDDREVAVRGRRPRGRRCAAIRPAAPQPSRPAGSSSRSSRGWTEPRSRRPSPRPRALRRRCRRTPARRHRGWAAPWCCAAPATSARRACPASG